MLGLFRTADRMRRVITAALEPEGLTMQQYNVLRILRGAGADGLQTLAIAERMVERTPGITRLVDRLERKGLVARERSPGDRRCVVCRITEEGSALLARLDPSMDRVDDMLDAVLSLDERRDLVELLDRIRAGLSEPDPEETRPDST